MCKVVKLGRRSTSQYDDIFGNQREVCKMRGGETERRAAFECGVLRITTKLFNESGINEESDLTWASVSFSRGRNQYKNGLMLSWKYFILVNSGNLSIVGTNALKSRVMWPWDLRNTKMEYYELDGAFGDFFL